MLSKKNVGATIAVRDLQKAKSFYEDKMGFEPLESDGENYISFKSGDRDFLVYQSKFAGGYKATIATWDTGNDLEKICAALKEKKVKFMHYDLPGTTRKGDIHQAGDMKMAWCADIDENILCLVGQ